MSCTSVEKSLRVMLKAKTAILNCKYTANVVNKYNYLPGTYHERKPDNFYDNINNGLIYKKHS